MSFFVKTKERHCRRAKELHEAQEQEVADPSLAKPIIIWAFGEKHLLFVVYFCAIVYSSTKAGIQ